VSGCLKGVCLRQIFERLPTLQQNKVANALQVVRHLDFRKTPVSCKSIWLNLSGLAVPELIHQDNTIVYSLDSGDGTVGVSETHIYSTTKPFGKNYNLHLEMCTSKVVYNILYNEFYKFFAPSQSLSQMVKTGHGNTMKEQEILFCKRFDMLAKNQRQLINVCFLKNKDLLRSWTFSTKDRLIQQFLINLIIEKSDHRFITSGLKEKMTNCLKVL
jgi:hypothetical protein